jgi:hypothetical protein
VHQNSHLHPQQLVVLVLKPVVLAELMSHQQVVAALVVPRILNHHLTPLLVMFLD